MPTNRQRVRRRLSAHLMTAEIVEAFARAQPLHARHMASIADPAEAFADDDRHELARLQSIVHTGLGVRPWETSPLDATDGACPFCAPPDDGADCMHAPRRAMELRRDLDKAAGR
ncbi:MAG: hypothetical protein Kow0032_28810 [Methyloligellaceae bacterium]